MPTLTPRKPKRVVAQQEALESANPAAEPPIINDPLITKLMGSRPECAPAPTVAQQQRIEEQQRQQRQAAIASETNGKNGTWAFVKNINPKEEILFKDGTKFSFKDNLLIVRDPELADKI